jgi:fructoselysine-6-P-deglycase FrlB-like protein
MPAFRGKPPYVMSEMIAAEPAHSERLLHRLAEDEVLETVAGAVRAAVEASRPIQVTGCGTSEHAAMAIATLLTEALEPAPGREPRAIPALEAIRRPLADGVLVSISHEGGTKATNEAIRAARAAGATSVLITVGKGSPGAEATELILRTGERTRAGATRSATSHRSSPAWRSRHG